MSTSKRYIVQHFDGAPHQWLDVGIYEAKDAGAALKQAFDDPTHKLQATTYRVAEEALAVNVSINLDPANSCDGMRDRHAAEHGGWKSRPVNPFELEDLCDADD